MADETQSGHMFPGDDEKKRAFARWVAAREPQVYPIWGEAHDREWLEAMAREDDARAEAQRQSWAAMREKWQGEADR